MVRSPDSDHPVFLLPSGPKPLTDPFQKIETQAQQASTNPAGSGGVIPLAPRHLVPGATPLAAPRSFLVHDMGMVDSLAPGFIVAVPQLLDPNFRQTVVLMLEQGEQGAMGVVVNRESALFLKELCGNHDIPYAGDPEKLVRMGGPVQPEQGLVIYGDEREDPEGRSVATGLHVSASTGTLGRLCNVAGCRFHCYTGYAGWAPGQLEREMNEGSWIVAPADAGLVLDCPADEIWDRALRNNGIDPAALVSGGGALA